ncbi:nucleotidyl transferase AbiEii/AbiGii toxin family protein [Nostoc sphaeroides CHAB 2801]|uniref:nucleotidyl transferase AbiEii/AbiGii toxin family protein n=1 Tax=Nostoc sphaeroides TaxID=446679 RepID=UPI001E4E86B8|nr:nucleotidyl transferase AbiEii/AbiGii toxin family protein [Nostoc sphaeroides]MCC5632583.1 nucleotidyl transferase AbiEii/AbiGii toxin family protein [Nostoc sphaeroides CHAB 2801]
MLLIGAQARLLVFDKQYKIQGRATKDWDVAVKLDSWNRYALLVNKMTQGKNPRFKTTSIIHKFIHINTGIEIDVIPFGDISNAEQEITWPDGNQMSILGLEETFTNTEVEKIDDIEFRIVKIYGFIALKLLAWNERQENKDLEDIVFVLENYEEEERIFEELIDEISSGVFEIDEAADVLIGIDICNRFQAKTLKQVKKVVNKIIKNKNQYLPKFVPKYLDGDDWDEAFDKIVKRFQALQYGLEKSST